MADGDWRPASTAGQWLTDAVNDDRMVELVEFRRKRCGIDLVDPGGHDVGPDAQIPRQVLLAPQRAQLVTFALATSSPNFAAVIPSNSPRSSLPKAMVGTLIMVLPVLTTTPSVWTAATAPIGTPTMSRSGLPGFRSATAGLGLPLTPLAPPEPVDIADQPVVVRLLVARHCRRLRRIAGSRSGTDKLRDCTTSARC